MKTSQMFNHRFVLALCLGLLVFIASAQFVQAAVPSAVAQIGSDNSQYSTSTTMSNFTIPAGTDRLLVVTASHTRSGDITSVTYDGTAMTQVIEEQDGFAVMAMFVLPMGTSMSASSGDISFTFATGANQSPADEKYIAAVVFQNVDQTTPAEAIPCVPAVDHCYDEDSGTPATIVSELTIDSEAGDLVMAAFNGYGDAEEASITVDPGQTVLHPNIGGATATGGFNRYIGTTEDGDTSVTSKFTAQTTTAGIAIMHIIMNINAAYNVTPEPEPSNDPTNFAATAVSTSQITTTWTDSTGSTLPDGYLVLCSTSNSFTAPTDGFTVADDTDCADGSGAQTIAQGTETAVWSSLNSETQYFFTIFPYTNPGALTDYKTDSPATANDTTLAPNTAPTTTSGNTASVPENQTSAIDVQATDDNDAEGSGLTFSLSGGADQALFGIDANTGVVTFNSAPDFENPSDANGDNNYEIQVTVTDSGGLTAVQDITISVTDVAENTAPTITSGNTASVPENQTSAIDVQATDDNDAEGSGLTFSLSGGADQALFGIDANTGVVTFNSAPDFENPSDANGDNGYEIQVTVTDSGSLTAVQDITISVTDVAENTAPTITSGNTASVPENQTSAIDVQATDDNDAEGSGLTFSLSGGADQALFGIDANTGVVTFNSAPDFENPSDANGDNDYEIQVTVTDSGSLTDVQDITVSVTDVAEDTTAPTAVPTLDPAPNAAGWHNSDVTINWNWTDEAGGSGIDSANCTMNSLVDSEGSSTVTAVCTDLAGNSAESAPVTVNLDKTAPVVSVTGVADGDTYILGDVPEAGCNTSDALSGVATAATVSLSGGNASGTGTITATCAGALDHAGNSGSASITYTVVTPQDAIDSLQDKIDALVDDGVLKRGQANGLEQPLQNAIRSLNKGKINAACNQLDDFIVEVNDKTPNPLDTATAADLIADAQAIQVAIGCD